MPIAIRPEISGKPSDEGEKGLLNSFFAAFMAGMNEQDNTPSVTQEAPSNQSPVAQKPGIPKGRSQKRPEKGRGFWIFVAIASGIGLVIDTFLVTPEDFIPVIGWLDEGMLGTILLVSLNKVGIEIPFLSRFFGGHSDKNNPPSDPAA